MAAQPAASPLDRPAPSPEHRPAPRRPHGATTQVAIIGGGPSGLLLARLLQLSGVRSIVIERQSEAHVMARIRAGVLEQGTVALLQKAEIGDRLVREGLVHHGFDLAVNGRRFRIAMDDLIGRHVTVYGQTEVTKDLMVAHHQAGTEMYHEVEDVALHDLETDAPAVTFTRHGEPWRVTADFVVGCDGFRGPSRQAIPAAKRAEFERVYPFGWLGILADVPPCQDELIYANSDRGFALASMRSPTRSRYYIQCPADEDIANWPDDRLWEALKQRLGPDVAASITTGPAIEKSIAPLRSFVCETMQHGRLFLAGDAAHIVPPTGAKGLNLAVGDVHYLATALIAFYANGEERGLRQYSTVALRRIWKAERFSWMLTTLLHDFDDDDAFGRRMKVAELDYIFSSRAAQISIAENYVGLPYDDVLA
ncbi:MAG: 4-hydroxybenzoate 3-monooxygenase [Pseudomonadota bacterium]